MAFLELLKPWYQKRTSFRWQYYIWLAVVLRLLLPVAPQINLMTVLWEKQAAMAMPEQKTDSSSQPDFFIMEGILQEVHSSVSGENSQQESAGTSLEGSQSSLPPQAFPTPPMGYNLLLAGLWFGVAMLMLGRKLLLHRRFVKKLHIASVPITAPLLLDRADKIRQRIGLKRNVRLMTCDGDFSPMLLGIFRPMVVLPGNAGSADSLDHVLLHELTHCKRYDLLYRGLVQLTLCLHWFNPMVYWMDREISRLCELSCDQEVLQSLDAGERRAYGDTLLRAAALGSSLGSSVSSLSLSRGGMLMKERLNAILCYREPPRSWKAAGISLSALFCVSGLFLGAYAAPLPRTEEWISPSAAPEAPSSSSLPQTEEPDAEGRFSPVSPEDFSRYTAEEQDAPDQPDIRHFPSFLEHPLGIRWLSENYPSVTDWEILYEKHDLVLSPQMYDPYRRQWMPCYAVVLSTQQGDGFDRLLILGQEEVIVTSDESDSGDLIPQLNLRISHYTGWEQDWQLGDCSGLETVFPQNSGQLPALWMPDQERGLLTEPGGICLPVKGLTQAPSPTFAVYPIDPSTGEEGDCLLALGGHQDYNIGYYQNRTQQLTLLTAQPGEWQITPLGEQTLALHQEHSIVLYSLFSNRFPQPAAVLEGSGGSLGEDGIHIYHQIATPWDETGWHAILYHREKALEWRLCIFDNTGNILQDLATGLSAAEGSVDGLTIHKGLIYFNYFRSDAADSMEKYCADAWSDSGRFLQQIG